MLNAYQVLGVPPTANAEQLKRAYRARARERHPDQGGSAAAFAELQEAYALVSDEQNRADYDAAWAVWLRDRGAAQCPACSLANRVPRAAVQPVCQACGTDLPRPAPQPLRERAAELAADLGDRLSTQVADLVVDGIEQGFRAVRRKLGLPARERRHG